MPFCPEILSERDGRAELCRRDAHTFGPIPEQRQIIAFQNRRVHGGRLMESEAGGQAIEAGRPWRMSTVQRRMHEHEPDGPEKPE